MLRWEQQKQLLYNQLNPPHCTTNKKNMEKYYYYYYTHFQDNLGKPVRKVKQV